MVVASELTYVPKNFSKLRMLWNDYDGKDDEPLSARQTSQMSQHMQLSSVVDKRQIQQMSQGFFT